MNPDSEVEKEGSSPNIISTLWLGSGQVVGEILALSKERDLRCNSTVAQCLTALFRFSPSGTNEGGLLR